MYPIPSMKRCVLRAILVLVILECSVMGREFLGVQDGSETSARPRPFGGVLGSRDGAFVGRIQGSAWRWRKRERDEPGKPEVPSKV